MIITRDTITFGIQIYPTKGSETLNDSTLYKEMDMRNYLDYNVKNYKLTCLSQPNHLNETSSREHVCLLADMNQLGLKNQTINSGKFNNYTPISGTDITFSNESEGTTKHRNKKFPELIISNWNSKILHFRIVDVTFNNPIDSLIKGYYLAYGAGDNVGKAVLGRYYTLAELRIIYRSGFTYFFQLEPYDIEKKSIIERPLTKTLCMVISSRDRDINQYQYGNEFSMVLKPINGGYKYYKALITSFTTRFHTSQVTSNINHPKYDLFSFGLNKANFGYGGFYNYFDDMYNDTATYMGSFFSTGAGWVNNTTIHNQVTGFNTNILTIEDNLGQVSFKTFVPNGLIVNTERKFFNGVWYETGVVNPNPFTGFALEDGFEWVMVLNLYGFN